METIKLFEVPNNKKGREKIRKLQDGLRNSPLRVILYGRHTDRKGLSERLLEENHPHTFDYQGHKLTPFYHHWMLKGRVPLDLSETIAVYVGNRPKSRWVQNENGNFENVPTKWAVDKS